MIAYEEFTLDNGLRVLVHQDKSSPAAVLNILYNVGSRDEDPNKTGFAHLFEHLMFGGSKNIPSYDEPLQRVGGDNNAFTSPDITNYYLTVPAANLETGFWLESDRMLSLSFDPKVLEVQRSVVIEEFKQRYLNQPYGDLWLKLRPLAYQTHPYNWPTIGKEISHIENATMEDVKDFFFKHYRPNNAVMVVAGNVELEEVKRLSEKWFDPIPAGNVPVRNLPQEPKQTQARKLTIEAAVPQDAFYTVFHMPGRDNPEYYTADLLSDVLGRGKSARLYAELVKEKALFIDLQAHVTGSIDPGLMVIGGRLSSGTSFQQAEEEVWKVINQLKQGLEFEELEKVKNQAASSIVFGELELLNRAMNLAYGAIMGNPNWVNEEIHHIRRVTNEQIVDMANRILVPENSSTVYYKSIPK